MTYPVFATGDPLPATDLNAIGLWLVKTQTVGSGVSSVTVTNAFSASYDNYKIIYSGGVNNTNDLALQIRFANTTGYYASMRYDSFTGVGSGTLATNNQTFGYFGLTGSVSQPFFSLDILNPFQTIFTKWSGFYVSNLYAGQGGGVYAQNTSQTDFTIIAPGSTMTGGTIRVYGYRN